MNESHIGRRLRELREGRGIKQDAMARLLGLNSRQIVSQIESGTRRLTASELMTVLGHFDVTLERLTNPFLLFGKSTFSWRQCRVSTADLDLFEERAGEWIGAFRELGRGDHGRLPKLLPHPRLTYASSFEDAALAGEAVAQQLDLGDRPAFRLAEVMQRDLEILVLMVDATSGISGAACHLPELNAVLINRHESFARRNSDLAHEFFHILTWNEMRPDRVESSVDGWDDVPSSKSTAHKRTRNQRIEQLADNFAAALLMPSKALDTLKDPRGDLAQWLTEASGVLGVSSRALKWRLVNSGRFPGAASVTDADLSSASRGRNEAPRPGSTPLPFSEPFIRIISSAVEEGRLSGMRAASLLGLGKLALGELCEAYGVVRPVELGGTSGAEPRPA